MPPTCVGNWPKHMIQSRPCSHPRCKCTTHVTIEYDSAWVCLTGSIMLLACRAEPGRLKPSKSGKRSDQTWSVNPGWVRWVGLGRFVPIHQVWFVLNYRTVRVIFSGQSLGLSTSILGEPIHGTDQVQMQF